MSVTFTDVVGVWIVEGVHNGRMLFPSTTFASSSSNVSLFQSFEYG